MLGSIKREEKPEMKKWWMILAALLLLLTGCSKDSKPIDRPPSLEVTYGDTAIYGQTTAYEWYWKDGRETDSATVDAEAMGISAEKLPSVNASKRTAIQLNFSEQPDRVLIQVYSAEDNYTEPREVDMVGGSTPAPLDGKNHLYSVSAVWMEGTSKFWGSCTYQFHFLAGGGMIGSPIEIEVAADLDLQGLLQLESNQVLGIEFLNNLEGTIRTCRSTADKTAILSCLRSNLTSELQPWEGDLPDTQYMLRVIAADGNQLTVGYSANGTVGCLEVGGKPYVAGVMDMETLWGSLKAGVMSQAAAASGKNYLEMSNEFPGEDWGTEFTYGYLKSLDQSVSYDEMRWIVDAEAPNGYVVEAGWPDQEAELSETCEFWILEDHQAPYCRVTAEELLKRDQDAETDVLYRIYTSEGKVIAICEQYAP